MKSIASLVIVGYLALFAILAAIAGLGISMVGKLQQTTTSMVDKELAIGLAAQEIRDRVTRLRQKEKSLFISIGRQPAPNRDDAPTQEFASLNDKINDLAQAIDQFTALPVADEAYRAANEMRADLTKYQQTIADIFERIQRGEIKSAREADDALVPSKHLVRFDRPGFKNISELPIVELVKAANEAKIGASETAKTILLFSVLATTIALIAAVLTIRRINQIERANVELRDTLEQRVEQRTAELSRSNEQLKQTLADLANAEDVLVKSEKLAALGRMVASIAHELNTPIGNALLASSTLQDQARQFRRSSETGLRRADLEGFLAGVDNGVNISHRNLQRAAELIGNFKQVAADQTSDQRREFNLDSVVHGVVITLEPMLRRAGVVVDVKAPPVIFDSYPGALIQILTNLMTNAAVHAFDNWSEARGPRQITIRAYPLSNTPRADMVLTVKDNGNGIPPEHRSRVFEHFFTTRTSQGGTGLGLSIVHTLTTVALGGKVEMTSELGSGTTFTLTLPVSAPVVGDQPEAQRTAA